VSIFCNFSKIIKKYAACNREGAYVHMLFCKVIDKIN